MLLSRCHYHEAPVDQDLDVKLIDEIFPVYIPGGPLDFYSSAPNGVVAATTSASLPLSKAIGLINRYCAKLPSDTFTRLTPLWRVERVQVNGLAVPCFKCCLRLPINCPVKEEVEAS
jgi:endoribonuclease Dicer